MIDRVLARLLQAPGGRLGASALIVLLIAGIGFVDYLTGTVATMLIFYLALVILALCWLGRPAAIGTALVCVVVRLAGDTVIFYPRPLPLRIWWNGLASFGTYLIVLWIVQNLLELYRQMEARVAERTRELSAAIDEGRRLENELANLTARERSVIGRELHDDLGQQLVATAFAAQVLAEQTAGRDEATAGVARNIVKWTEECIAKTRRLARGLLQAEIAPDRLGGELAELTKVSSVGGVECRFEQQGGPVAASASACAQLFRIAQEAISNALRHARCRRLNVTLAVAADGARLAIEDDGCGLNGMTPADSPGIGLKIMQYRTLLIGGTLTLEHPLGGGTRVVCQLPALPAPST